MLSGNLVFSEDEIFVDRCIQRFGLDIDKNLSTREKKLIILQKFRDGSIYDRLEPYHQEYSGGNGSYVKLSSRRPSVIYKLPDLIVQDTVSMLFGDDHFPTVKCSEHEETTQLLQYLTKSCKIKECMVNAATEGSIGSVCILIKILNGKFYFDVLNTIHLTPIFDKNEPDCLISLTQKIRMDGSTLMAYGYEIDKDEKNKKFYLIRKWTDQEEIYYKPYKCEDEREGFELKKDNEKSCSHGLGFVPAIWIKNSPNCHKIDGKCTFEGILDISVEIDYQLSQLGRLLKYNSDPTLVIKNPTVLEGQQLIKGIGTLNLDEKGDAYMLELSTGATKSVIEYVELLRKYGLEIAHGNRINPDKVSAAHSGKAMQMVHSSLISLVEKMRLTYGENGLIRLYSMIMKILKSGQYEFNYSIDVNLNDACCDDDIELSWPDWYPPLPIDKLQQAQAIQVLLDNNVITQRTATNSVANEYNIGDVEKEIKDIESSQQIEYDDEKESPESESVDR